MAEITAELELPALLEDIVERATGLVGASGGELALYDEAQPGTAHRRQPQAGRRVCGDAPKAGRGRHGPRG